MNADLMTITRGQYEEDMATAEKRGGGQALAWVATNLEKSHDAATYDTLTLAHAWALIVDEHVGAGARHRCAHDEAVGLIVTVRDYADAARLAARLDLTLIPGIPGITRWIGTAHDVQVRVQHVTFTSTGAEAA